MMRRTLMAAAFVPALLAGTGTAFAQTVVIEDPPPAAYVLPAAPPAPTYYYYYDAPPPPSRVIRYYRYRVAPDDHVIVVRPRVRTTCGPNAYWNGEGCVYARW